MRHTRYYILAALLLLPSGTTGASKEMMEMQRDIAQLQSQIQTLQSGFDQRMAAVQTLVQQTLDAANKANTGVSVLNAGVSSTLDRNLHTALTPLAGLGAKVDNTNDDVATLRNQVTDLNAQMNRMQQMLTDLNSNIKVMCTPAAPAPPAPAASAPPPDAGVVFNNAVRDENGGKLDQAIGEYQDFIKFFPDNPNAARAQYNIGNSHYTQGKYDLAARDFDAVIANYPEDMTLTPQAYFMKGMSLKSISKPQAVNTWKQVIAKYPKSDAAAQAKEQLRAAGVSVGGPAPRKPH